MSSTNANGDAGEPNVNGTDWTSNNAPGDAGSRRTSNPNRGAGVDYHNADDGGPHRHPRSFSAQRAQTFATVNSGGIPGAGEESSEEEDDALELSKRVLRLQDRERRPSREPIAGATSTRPPTLQDAVRYYIRRKNIARLIAGFHGNHSVILCKNCSALDLKAEKFIVVDREISDDDERVQKLPSFRAGSGSGRQKLGHLKKIVLKSLWCSFCKLIVQSLQEQPGFKDWLSTHAVVENTLNEEQRAYLGVICRASWQIDGQTRRHDTHDTRRRHLLSSDGRRARTRRIRIDWNDPRIETSYLVLLAGPAKRQIEATIKRADFFGQHIETRESSVSLMQNWIKRCEEDHGPRCNPQRHTDDLDIRQQPYFGVIDLEESRISKLPLGEKYAALSYCWGANWRGGHKRPARTTRSNIRAYQARGGIERIMSQIPKTIRDSMTLARRLGMRYFWVDALCIVQDSPETWQLNANIMDQIYSNAYFTICAADGEDAWEGLTGLSEEREDCAEELENIRNGASPDTKVGRRYVQKIEPYSKDTRLMVSYPADSYIDKSTWNTRAWTFQERLLSHRCLIFVDGRVFFQCRTMVLREDIITESKDGWSVEHRNTPLELLGDIDYRPLSVYIRCVELYTARNLSKPIDILNAFKGVGNYIGKVLGRQGLLYGLPRSHFDWALLWQCSAEEDNRFRGKWEQAENFNDQKPPLDHPADFPSWSWCGWMHGNESPARYSNSMVDGTMANVQDWLVKHTWIVWYVRDGHGNLRLVWNPEREEGEGDPKLPKQWQGYPLTYRRNPRAQEQIIQEDRETMARSEQYQCEASDHDSDQQGEQDLIDRYGRLQYEEYDPRNKFEKTLDDFPFAATALNTIEDEERYPLGRDVFKLSDMRYLQFWTHVAYFRLVRFGDIQVTAHEYHRNSRINRRWAIVDRINEIRGVIVPDRESWEIAEKSETLKLGRQPHCFLALSHAKEFSPEELRGWDEYKSREVEGLPWNLFYVMLVHEVNGVHYRLGLGKVDKEAFRYSCKEDADWKEIILG